MSHPFLDKALKENMDAVYMMGFDVWSDGTAMDVYLQECRSSEKYKKGTWYVLKK